MTAEFAEPYPHPDMRVETPQLTVVEGPATPAEPAANRLFADFSQRAGITALVATLEQGRQGMAASFNASLLDFVSERAPAFREQAPFGSPKNAQPAIASTSRSYLSSFYHELKQKGNETERQRFRSQQLEHFGRIALQNYTNYAEIGITNRIAAGYRDAGKREVVRVIGDVMIVFGRVIESLQQQAEGYPEASE